MGLFNKKRIEQPIQPVSKPVNTVKENTSMVIAEKLPERIAVKQQPEVEMYEDEEVAEKVSNETENEYDESENEETVPAPDEMLDETSQDEFDEEALKTELRTMISHLEANDARLTKIESFLFRNMR